MGLGLGGDVSQKTEEETARTVNRNTLAHVSLHALGR